MKKVMIIITMLHVFPLITRTVKWEIFSTLRVLAVIMESFCLQNFNYLVSTHDYVTLISFYSQRFCHGVRLLEKVVLQDNLSTLVVNLYPRNEGYSLMLKGKISIPSALSVKGQRFTVFSSWQIFSIEVPT